MCRFLLSHLELPNSVSRDRSLVVIASIALASVTVGCTIYPEGSPFILLLRYLYVTG